MKRLCMQYAHDCPRPSFYLKYLVKKGCKSSNIAFRVMPHALQLHLVMMGLVYQVWCLYLQDF